MQESNEQDVPPIEPPPPDELPPGSGEADGALESYHKVTDLVGGPSIRVRDNVVSGIGLLIGALVGVLGAWLATGPNASFQIPFMSMIPPAIIMGLGALVGAALGVFIAGFVLMILGLLRR